MKISLRSGEALIIQSDVNGHGEIYFEVGFY